MILTSANTLESKKILDYKGLVTGESLIGSNIYKDLFSGVRDVVAGRTSQYEEELEKARNIALKSMEEKAESLGANAIIGLKISYDNLGGTMGNTILVTAYGTAISYEENEL
ncbi:heavy metal-binding domain-containing protein [uncultured Methanobrevibacter sp.]|uniref:heavy metal-binding domain-containing protein n=1 Tax=uncultured Methanobrevibacter sp. TaxID=253161 RepID=UPI0026057687|nr:heavy metal-binding domain-containing protein [uncultured Methanobrevibacter sp.]